MSISPAIRDHRVANVPVTQKPVIVQLRHGREIRALLDWFPRLAWASAEQRAQRELAAAGHGIHWPSIDEQLSVEGLRKDEPAPPGSSGA